MTRLTIHRPLAGLLLLLVLAISGPAFADDEQAKRQLDLAEQDLADGNWERAAASAASAFRLDGALHQALVVRALALMEMGQLEAAKGLLTAYVDLRGALEADRRVEPAMERIEVSLVPTGPGARAQVAPRRPIGVALLISGLAAGAAGLIIAGASHSQGAGIADEMGTPAAFDARYADYEAARTGEQVGVGVAIGGGVVAAVGTVTFAIPEPNRQVGRRR